MKIKNMVATRHEARLVVRFDGGGGVSCLVMVVDLIWEDLKVIYVK
jgi:hypothetical protein